MARPQSTPEQRHQQRQRIRRAAADVYREDGVRGVTARAVSKRAGVSTGTLYSYYANLEDLLQSLWTEPVARIGREIEELVAEIVDPFDRIQALLAAYAEFSIDQPDVFRGAMLYVRPATAPAPEPDAPDALPFYRLLRDAVIDGQHSGRVESGDPDVITQVLWAGIHGALALPVNMHRFAVQPQQVLADAAIDMLMTAIDARSVISAR